MASFIPLHSSPDFTAMLGLEPGDLEYCGRDIDVDVETGKIQGMF